MLEVSTRLLVASWAAQAPSRQVRLPSLQKKKKIIEKSSNIRRKCAHMHIHIHSGLPGCIYNILWRHNMTIASSNCKDNIIQSHCSGHKNPFSLHSISNLLAGYTTKNKPNQQDFNKNISFVHPDLQQWTDISVAVVPWRRWVSLHLVSDCLSISEGQELRNEMKA